MSKAAARAGEMGIHRELYFAAGGGPGNPGIRAPDAVAEIRRGSEDADLLVVLLVQSFGVSFLGRGGFNGQRLVWTGAAVHVSGRGFDVGILTKPGEIGAQGRLELLVVESILNFRHGLFQGRDSGFLMVDHLEDPVSLLGAYD